MNPEQKEHDAAHGSAAGSGADHEPKTGPVTEQEAEDVEERSAPRIPVIYEVVRRQGEEELERPAVSLWWSGVAAGLSMSFSLLAQALLQQHLPDTTWRPLVSGAGYVVGFVMVVLGRQQLFTENTVTVVLPLVARFDALTLRKVARLWGIVLVANFCGTLFAALFCRFLPVLDHEVVEQMLAVSQPILEYTWSEMFLRSVTAGFLVATMVWLLPSAQGSQFAVVVLMSYLIAITGSVHIVTGSMEAFMLALHDRLDWGGVLAHFALPALAGNVVGGTALFALLAHGQVMKEIEQ